MVVSSGYSSSLVRLCLVFSLAFSLLSVGCGGDTPPETTTDTELSCSVDSDCVDGRCVNGMCAEMDGGSDPRDVGPDSRPSDATPGGDVDLRGDAAPSSDADASADSDTEPPVGSGDLYTVCDSDSDCPVSGTTCMKSFRLSREADWDGSGTIATHVTATELTSGRVMQGRGICTASCTASSESCSGLQSGSPSQNWVCQLVGISSPLYPERDANGELSFPFDDQLDVSELDEGQPFVAMCRPPQSAAPDAHKKLCGSCTTSAECGGGICWDFMTQSEAGSNSGLSGTCLSACSADADCPLGFACDAEVAGSSYCRPRLDTCGECADIDSDGYGRGKCITGGYASAIDCDDRDADAFYDSDDTSPDPARCGPQVDTNCNGISDDMELIGSDVYMAEHCGDCFDVCDDSLFSTSGANATAECVDTDPNDQISQGPGVRTCTIGCSPGFEDCNGDPGDGCEVDLSEMGNCGGCGAVCQSSNASVDEVICANEGTTLQPTYTCSIGLCVGTHADCNSEVSDGCEINTADDVNNCGSCGNNCVLNNATEACQNGQCRVDSCDADYGNCDNDPSNGCEQGLASDIQNCGACGNQCSYPNATAVCTAGSCEMGSCLAGFADCDGLASNGCEVDTRSDAQNCGGCGNVCDLANASESCAQSQCQVASCHADFGDCDAAPANGCEVSLTTDTDCGACGNICAGSSGTLGSECQQNAGTYACECVDNGVEYCDGVQNVCGVAADTTCPLTLDFQDAPIEWPAKISTSQRMGNRAATSLDVQWCSAVSTGVCTEASSGSFNPVTSHILTRLEVKGDDNGIHQIMPYWSNGFTLTEPSTAVQPGTDYGTYQISPMSATPSAYPMGVVDGNFNTASPRINGVPYSGTVDCGNGVDADGDGAYEQLPMMIGLNVYYSDCGTETIDAGANGCTNPYGCNRCVEAVDIQNTGSYYKDLQEPIVGLEAVCRNVEVRSVASGSMPAADRYELQFIGTLYAGSSAGTTTGRSDEIPHASRRGNGEQGPIGIILSEDNSSPYPRIFTSGTQDSVWTFYRLAVGTGDLDEMVLVAP